MEIEDKTQEGEGGIVRKLSVLRHFHSSERQILARSIREWENLGGRKSRFEDENLLDILTT